MARQDPQLKDGIAGWQLDNSYARLPATLYSRVLPEPVSAPRLVLLNVPLAQELGLDAEYLRTDEGVGVLAGNRLPPGSHPLAQAYAGHQFGHFTMLGDGRAVLIGEQITPSGQRLDIQLKGSGQTPYSRRGDGRAALGPMLREYLISEAMHALGIPTTRSLAVVATGETVFRESGLPGAILARVAASHIRCGTFEYLAGRRDIPTLRILTDYTLRRHFPDHADTVHPARTLLDQVIERQVALIAQWMAIGFIHGVMNTDNMALSGQTIDYGPCAFMDAYAPETVFSSIDHQGRYAYGRQPGMMHWNLIRFAETLVPILHEEQASAIEIARVLLDAVSERFSHVWTAHLRAKVGFTVEEPGDSAFMKELLQWMHHHQADYTNTFRELSTGAMPTGDRYQEEAFQDWYKRWLSRLSRQPEPLNEVFAAMQTVNPAYIPRNHQVEAALEAATFAGDMHPLNRLLEALSQPYTDRAEYADLRHPAPASFGDYQTFCGT